MLLIDCNTHETVKRSTVDTSIVKRSGHLYIWLGVQPKDIAAALINEYGKAEGSDRGTVSLKNAQGGYVGEHEAAESRAGRKGNGVGMARERGNKFWSN
jgi:hypothetical protein